MLGEKVVGGIPQRESGNFEQRMEERRLKGMGPAALKSLGWCLVGEASKRAKVTAWTETHN